jgi:RNA polymerase sigma-70 factor, ECF subfamily
MKPRERAMLWLAYVEGRTHQEIGAILDLQAASVRVLLFRARGVLARRLRRLGLFPR